MGRPQTVRAPPCPTCSSTAAVRSHALQVVDGEPKRSFRCAECAKVFVPGVRNDAASAELREAVRRVRAETGVPYRLIAEAITRNLGVHVSHTTVMSWCREATPSRDEGTEAPCEYLSILWALQREIQEEGRTTPARR